MSWLGWSILTILDHTAIPPYSITYSSIWSINIYAGAINRIIQEPHRQNRRKQRARSRSHANKTSPFLRSPNYEARAICKAPRLDNQQLMELHDFGALNSKGQARPAPSRTSEFLELWMDQLEETTRQMPHETLLQRVLELENELLETQEKLKKATRDLLVRRGSGNQVTSSVLSAPPSPMYCASPRPSQAGGSHTAASSPLYYSSPLYQSPRLISPSAE